ncbi:MAG: ubiquinol-cytochrome c reductase iron-sulfur subunit [Acidimicrobiia bacterium]
MTAPQILALAVAAVAIMGMVAVFAIAFRRETAESPAPLLDRRTRRRDRSMAVPVLARPGRPEERTIPEPAPPPRGPVEEEEEEEGEAVEAVQVRRVEEVPAEEAGVTRRQFFNRALLTAFGAYLALMGLSMLAFFWPKLGGGFGADIDAGDVDELLGRLRQADGTIAAAGGYIPEARAYVVPFSDDETAGTAFEGTSVVAGGVTALYQRCVHLGCRVPWCDTSQGFECPCHGSRYNQHGEYEGGPAPRNMDRFEVQVDERNHLIIRTSSIIETPRADRKTVPYPQGPACIAI